MRYLLSILIVALSVSSFAADLSPTAASVRAVSGTTATGLIGYAGTAGDLVVLTNTGWELSDADTDNGGKTAGILTTAPVATDREGVVQLDGICDIAASLTAGTLYVGSTTAGKIAPLSDLQGAAAEKYLLVVGINEEDDGANNNLDLILKSFSILVPTGT